MKLTKLIITAFAAFGVAATASAQEVINITGATAFREAAHQAILASFDAGRTYAFAGTNLGNSGRAIFSGTINGGATAVTVRTSWSGSVAGTRAIVNQADNVTYFTSGNLTGLTANGTQNWNPVTQNTTANFVAFTDNTQSNSNFNAISLLGGPVGVIAFVPTINDNTFLTSNATNPVNITTLKLRRAIVAGFVPLQFITGNSSHSGVRVYWTGRNDLSGTRAIYLTELGLPASQSSINQYRVEPLNSSPTDPITALRLWPTGDGSNASTTWRADAAGAGGYNSGAGLTPLFQRQMSSSVAIKDAGNATTSTRNATNTLILTVISSQDANDIQVGGGQILAYNGSRIEPEAFPTGLNAADKEKIANGSYTFWSYENLYYRDDSSQATLDLIALIEAGIPGAIGGNGVPISTMKVSRAADGGSLTVLSSLL